MSTDLTDLEERLRRGLGTYADSTRVAPPPAAELARRAASGPKPSWLGQRRSIPATPDRLFGTRRPGWRVAVTCALSVALAVGFTVAQNVRTGSGAPPLAPVANAADVLHRAGLASLHEPRPRSGQFFYLKDVRKINARWNGDGVLTHKWFSGCDESWAPINGTQALTLGARESKTGCIMHKPITDIPKLRNFTTAIERLRRSGLPADPTALRARLYREAARGCAAWEIGAACTRDDTVFALVTTMVRGPVGPELQAGSFAVAATVPGVSLVRDVVDAAGRPAVAVQRRNTDRVHADQILFDPVTYRYLGYRLVLVRPQDGLQPGEVTFTMARVRSGYVDKWASVPRPGISWAARGRTRSRSRAVPAP